MAEQTWKTIIRAVAYRERWFRLRNIDPNPIRHAYHQRTFPSAIYELDEVDTSLWSESARATSLILLHDEEDEPDFIMEQISVTTKLIYLRILPIQDRLRIGMYEVEVECDHPDSTPKYGPLQEVEHTVTWEELFTTYPIILPLLEKFDIQQLLRSF